MYQNGKKGGLSMEDFLLTVAEVAARLKTNKNYVYTLIEKKLLNALKIGNLKVRNSELNRFLKDYEGKDLSNLDNITDLAS
jgi:excisionase family DNA binding protein